MTFEAHFDHKQKEKAIWQSWMSHDLFHAEVDHSKPPFTVLIPPPNVTSRLHMGHGLNNTLQDILVRWKRMQGYNSMWLPGTDHAGIATQMMVEKHIEKEGLSRKTLGRKAFLEKCVQWREDNGRVIIDQLKRLGFSCDWSREAYTMDESLSKAVRAIFVKLFDEGLIYRGERLVNWDPVLQTAVSDDEVESKETQGHLWTYKYPVCDSDGEYIEISTTRPETMFGDSAVAVHPEDERYSHLVGKDVIVPLINRRVKVIADDYVKKDFGTGCVKITPAHDPNDFAIGVRHKLEFINVMKTDASMNDICPEEFRGLDRFKARALVIKRLKEEGLFVELKSCKHAIPYSERSKAIIEPRLSKQWFVRMKELAKPALEYAQNEELNFHPMSLKKTYCHWLENIQDWCISRQLWWGHQIPIWYCGSCHKESTGIEDPIKCKHCSSSDLKRDEDVLDTWFSSWLWPLSPFGWPKETKELDYFFPSNVLITGDEIIFLWVARMIMVSHFLKKKLAFKDVYFNSVICDKQGRKFSKTLGNGIDPLEVIDQRGADAVRYTCVSLAPIGGRVKMELSDFELGSRFVNKIWNSAKFLLSYIDENKKELKDFDENSLSLHYQWLLHELYLCVDKVNTSFKNFRINDGVDTIFHFVWRVFCDWGLESAKEDLNKNNHEKEQSLSVLYYCFDQMLRLLSPITPFVTEDIWQKSPAHPRLDRPSHLSVASFPENSKLPKFEEEHHQWKFVQDIIGQVRSVRTQAGVPIKEKVEVYIKCENKYHNLLDQAKSRIMSLAYVSKVVFSEDILRPEKSLLATGTRFSVFVPVGDFLDFTKEKKRLQNEETRIAKITLGLKAKLNNENFCARAPEDIITKTREQLLNMEQQLKEIKTNLSYIE